METIYVDDDLDNEYDPLLYCPYNQITVETGENPPFLCAMDAVPLKSWSDREWAKEILETPVYSPIRDMNRAINAALHDTRSRFCLIDFHFREAATYVGRRKAEKMKAKKKKDKKKKKSVATNTDAGIEHAESEAGQGNSETDAEKAEEGKETAEKAKAQLQENSRTLHRLSQTEVAKLDWYDEWKEREDRRKKDKEELKEEVQGLESKAKVQDLKVTYVCQLSKEVEEKLYNHCAECMSNARAIVKIYNQALVVLKKFLQQLASIPKGSKEIYARCADEEAKVSIISIIIFEWPAMALQFKSIVGSLYIVIDFIKTYITKGTAKGEKEPIEVYNINEDFYDTYMIGIQKANKKTAKADSERDLGTMRSDLTATGKECQEDEELYECLARCPYKIPSDIV